MVLRLVSGPMLEKGNRTEPLADPKKVLLIARRRVSLFLGFSTTRETENFSGLPGNSRKFSRENFSSMIFLNFFRFSGLIFGSFYFTTNFWLPKFENRGCTTGNFPYCKNRTAGTEKWLRNHDFQTSVIEISGEIVTSLIFSILLSYFDKLSWSFSIFSTN